MFENYLMKRQLERDSGIKGIYQIYVSNKYTKTQAPKLLFFADWMEEMGFVCDALVQFVPENGGLTLTLCENIPDYRALMQQTRESGGILVETRTTYCSKFPTVNIGSIYIEKTGLQYGDALCVRYEPGFIRMRKLPNGTDKLVATVLHGKWLYRMGFVAGTMVKLVPENGAVTCFLQPNGKTDSNSVPVKILNGYRSKFEIPPAVLAVAGLGDERIFVASLADGVIRVQKLDFAALGF